MADYVYVSEFREVGDDMQGNKIAVYRNNVQSQRITAAASGANSIQLNSKTKYVRLEAASGNSGDIGVQFGVSSVVASADGTDTFSLGPSSVAEYYPTEDERYIDANTIS